MVKFAKGEISDIGLPSRASHVRLVKFAKGEISDIELPPRASPVRLVAHSSPVKSLILASPIKSRVSVAISLLRIGSSGALPSASAMAARRLISVISTVCAVAVSEIETNIHRSNKDLTLMKLSPSLEPCGALCPVVMVLKSSSDFFKGQPKKPSESKSSPLPDNN